MTPDERSELMAAVDRFAASADRLLANSNGGNVNFSVNAGGVGVWVAVTCCLVMLVCTFFMAGGLFWVAMDSRDRGHQMNALYMSVPGLRELVENQMRLNEQTQRATAEEPAP